MKLATVKGWIQWHLVYVQCWATNTSETQYSDSLKMKTEKGHLKPSDEAQVTKDEMPCGLLSDYKGNFKKTANTSQA